MRQPLSANVRRRKIAVGKMQPAPVGGWDAISPLANMKPDRAIELENFFPSTGYVSIRRGFGLHNIVSTSGTAVESLLPYHAATTANSKLFAACGSRIVNVTSEGSTSAVVTGLSNARWQYENFRTTGGNFLWICNGADEPRHWNNTSWTTLASPTLSGTGLSNASIVSVTAHKRRLWLTTTNDTRAWYLPIDSVQGAATSFQLGGLFSKGGFLQAIGTWTRDGGAGLDDVIAFFSSEGQVVIYEGTNPASDFNMIGVFDIAPPLGRRCLTKVGGDLAVVTLDGVLSLGLALGKDRALLESTAITSNIREAVHENAALYGNNFGWQLTPYPAGTMAILNVPLSERELQHQFVMNTVTGAWCKFTGQNANCWTVYDDRLFFGGNDGNVYEADLYASDYQATLTAQLRTAFNFHGSPGQQKQFLMLKPIITLDTDTTPSIAVDVDFTEAGQLSTTGATINATAKWDEVNWDEFEWADEVSTYSEWSSIGAIGQAASVRMAVSVTADAPPARWGVARWGESRWGTVTGGAPVTFQLNGFYMTMEPGEVL